MTYKRIAGAGVLYSWEWRNANNTASLPCFEIYSFAVKSFVRGENNRYRSPNWMVFRIVL